MTREVTEDEAALLDALAAEKPMRAELAELQALRAEAKMRLDDIDAKIANVCGQLDGYYMNGLHGDSHLLAAIRRVRGA